jgi:hypothetical protein
MVCLLLLTVTLYGGKWSRTCAYELNCRFKLNGDDVISVLSSRPPNMSSLPMTFISLMI